MRLETGYLKFEIGLRRLHRVGFGKLKVGSWIALLLGIATLAGNGEALLRLARNAAWVAERLDGYRMTTFAYPFGDYSDTSIEVVREIGFDAAVTTDHDVVRASYDRLRLPRLQVGDWTADRLSHGLNAV